MPKVIDKPAPPVKGTPQAKRIKALMRYAERFPLIPLHKPASIIWERDRKGKWVKVPAGKMPLHKQWTTRRYGPKVRALCIERGLNVGVRLTDEMIVLDVDPRNGGDVSLGAFAHDFAIDFSKFPCVITAGGGMHFYMSKPADVCINETLEDYPGLEFKTKGRQVVAAGSIHPNGMWYVWSEDHPAIEDGLPPAPKRLLRQIAYTPSSNGGEGGGEWTPAQVGAALARLDPRKFNSNDKWLPLMQACHHASGGEALAEFIAWSTSDPDYARDEGKIKKRWDSLRRRSGQVVTIRTLFKLLRENGASDLVPANVVHDDEFPED